MSDIETKFIIRAIKQGQGLEEVRAGLEKLDAQTKKTGKSTSELQNFLKGLLPAMGVAAVVAGMKSMSDSALQYADAVDAVADITGVSAEQASKWVVQAQHVGVSAETVANGMAILSKNIIAGSENFDKFGIKIRDTTGSMLPLDNIIEQVRRKEKELGEGAATTAMEMQLFGKAGKELHDFLSADNEEMNNVVNTARDLGLILDKVSSNEMEQMNRRLNDGKMVSQALGMQINDNLMPIMLRFQQVLLEGAKAMNILFGNKIQQDIKAADLSIQASQKNIMGSMAKTTEILFNQGKISKEVYDQRIAAYKGISDRQQAQETQQINSFKIVTDGDKKAKADSEKTAEAHAKKVEQIEQQLKKDIEKIEKKDYANRIKYLDNYVKEYKKAGVDKKIIDQWYKAEVEKLDKDLADKRIQEIKRVAGSNSAEMIGMLELEKIKQAEGTLSWQAYSDAIVAITQEATQKEFEAYKSSFENIDTANKDFAASFKDVLNIMLEEGIKKKLKAELAAWGAAETAKAWASAPMTFGGSLLALVPIALAITAGMAAINAVKLAKGGIVDSPTNAVIGEAGREAVIPLDSSKGKDALKQLESSTATYNINLNVGAFMGNDNDALQFSKLIYYYIKKIERRELTV